MPHRPAHRGLLLALITVLLSACVGQDAFRRGEEQLLARQWEPAINSFTEASNQAPGNLEYRAAINRASERAVNVLLSEAAALRDKQPAQASEIYQRVLALSPANERASMGLLGIETAKRQQRMFEEAVRAASNGREQEARAKYKKLLDEKVGLEDIAEFDPQLYTTMRNILASDQVDTMDLTFSATFDNFGMEEIVDLVPSGRELPVTNANKQEFVDRYVDWYLNSSVQQQFEPFYRGFYKVISKESIRVV